jgi:5-methylcytosine-specific restriction protein A
MRLCPGCGARHSRRGRCPACQRQYEKQRGTPAQRGYDQEHRKLRLLALAAHPFCLDCGATSDLCADHLVPRSRGGANTLSNYAVRCRGCNSRRAQVSLSRRRDNSSYTPTTIRDFVA